MSRHPWAIVALFIACLACDGRPRARIATGELEEGAPPPSSANVYRFVGVEQSLADARKALEAERWDDARAAAEALLKQDPAHSEAAGIIEHASKEQSAAAAFEAFGRALSTHDFVAIAGSFRQLPLTSVYYQRARPEYERLRDQWTEQREAELRGWIQRGRCRDAHRVVRAVGELFPEVRPRLEAIDATCVAETGQEPEVEPPIVAPRPAIDAPVVNVAPVVAASPLPPDAPLPPRPLPPPPLPAPRPPVSTVPRTVPPMELEKLRLAGQKRPPLPAGANMIAHRDHVAQILIGVALCLSAAGVPTRVDLIKPSDYSDANERVLADVKAWRFQPFTIDGIAVPVCTTLLFIYKLE